MGQMNDKERKNASKYQNVVRMVHDRMNEDAVTVAATQHMDTAQSGYQQSAKPSRSRVNLRGTTAHVKGAEYRSGTGSARASLGTGGQMKPTSTNVPTRFMRSVKNAPSTQGASGQLKPSSTSGSSSFSYTGSRQYFTVPDNITGVVRVFPLGTAGSSATGSTNIFNVVYQFRLNDMYNLLSSDLTYYQQVKMHLQLLDDMFAGNRNIRFNRKTNKLFIDVNWYETFSPGDHVIFEVFAIIDPETYTEVYNDIFLRRYATALIKRQWGDNLKKFQGMKLPGGVEMNGQKIYDEAEEELLKLEDEMSTRYELPVDFMVG